MEFGLTRLTAAPVRGKLHGVDIELNPLDLKRWGCIEQYLRQQIVSAAAQACVGLPPERARIVMREAHKEAAATSLMSEDARAGLFSSMETLLQVVYHSLHIGDPKITVDRVSTMIGTDFEALSKMAEVIFDISFPEMDVVDEKNSEAGQADKQ